MNIHLNFFSNALSVFKEKVLFSLTAQQKKILVIASIAFGLLAAYYVVSHFFKNQAKLVKEKKIFSFKKDSVPQQVEKPLEKSEEKSVSRKEDKTPFFSDQPKVVLSSESVPEPNPEQRTKEKETPKPESEPEHVKIKSDSTKDVETLHPAQPELKFEPEIREIKEIQVKEEETQTTVKSEPVLVKLELESSTDDVDIQPQIQPKAEVELEMHEIKVIHSKNEPRGAHALFYYNSHFAKPQLNAQTEQEAYLLKGRLLIKDIDLTFAEAQEIYATHKKDRQKFIKILFFLMNDSNQAPSLRFFKTLLKLWRACHTNDPLPNFMLTDFKRIFLDRTCNYPLCRDLQEVLKLYFTQMTAEDFADAALLYPLPLPERAVPLFINPSPIPLFTAYRKNDVRIVEEGTHREITEYVDPEEEELRKLFNSLYSEAAKKFRPVRKTNKAIA